MVGGVGREDGGRNGRRNGEKGIEMVKELRRKEGVRVSGKIRRIKNRR